MFELNWIINYYEFIIIQYFKQIEMTQRHNITLLIMVCFYFKIHTYEILIKYLQCIIN